MPDILEQFVAFQARTKPGLSLHPLATLSLPPWVWVVFRSFLSLRFSIAPGRVPPGTRTLV